MKISSLNDILGIRNHNGNVTGTSNLTGTKHLRCPDSLQGSHRHGSIHQLEVSFHWLQVVYRYGLALHLLSRLWFEQRHLEDLLELPMRLQDR